MEFIYLGGLLTSVAFGAFFAVIEASLLSLKPMQVRRLKEKNPAFGQPLADVLERPDRLISVLVIGSTFAWFCATLLAWLCLKDLMHLDWPVWADWLAISLFLLVFMEVVPKSVALRRSLSLSRRLVEPTRLVMRLLRPLRRLLETVTAATLSVFAFRFLRPAGKLDQHEFQTLIDAGRQEGLLKESESRMIQNIVRLGDRMVKDVMTPMVDVARVGDEWPRERVLETIQKARHRSIPVFDDDPNFIIGVLNAKRFAANPSSDLSELIDPPYLVPETMKALTLLTEFQSRRERLALVVDEFGNFAGVVTEGDIHEEIFGGLHQEGIQSGWLLERLGQERYLVDGSMRLDDLREEIGLSIEHEGVDTLGGYLQVQLENRAVAGASITEDGTRLTVYKISRNRVLKVLVERGVTL